MQDLTDELRREEQRVLALIPAAKRGDQQAVHAVVAYVYNRWVGRVERYYHEDPALSREDIQAEFMAGIWRGINVVDERGEPLFHLSQRGVWRVSSTIRQQRRQRHGAEEGGVSMVSIEEEDIRELIDHDADFVEVHLEADYAQHRLVRMFAGAALDGTPRRLLDLLATGKRTPAEEGFTRLAAVDLGVSEQRVSQCMSKIRAELARHDPELSA